MSANLGPVPLVSSRDTPKPTTPAISACLKAICLSQSDTLTARVMIPTTINVEDLRRSNDVSNSFITTDPILGFPSITILHQEAKQNWIQIAVVNS